MRARPPPSGATLFVVEPGEERAHGDGVGRAGVRVADVGGEEIEEPQLGVLAGVGDQSRHQHRGRVGRDDDCRRLDDRERLAGQLDRVILGRLFSLAHAAPVFLFSVF